MTAGGGGGAGQSCARGAAVPAAARSRPSGCRACHRSGLAWPLAVAAGQRKGVASSGTPSRRSSAPCRDMDVNAGRRKLPLPSTRLPGRWDPAAAPHAAEPPQPTRGGWAGRWLRSAPAPAPLPGPGTGTGGLGRPCHRSASWARFCRPSVRGTGGLLRRGFAVCRAPLGSHRRGWGLCERQLRSPPVMDGDKVEIDGGIMEGVSTSGGLASPYLAPGSGDGRAGSRPRGGRCRSA